MAIDDKGLTIKTLEEIKADIEAEQLSTINAALIISADEPTGQMNGIFADSQRQVWEVVQVAYDAFNRDAAEGKLLDNIGALTGTTRLKATRTRIEKCDVDLDIGTTLVAGADFAHVFDSPETRFTIAATFTAPSSGVHQLTFVAEEFGPITVAVDRLNVIATPKTGWNSITNPAGSTQKVGRLEQNDPDYRDLQEDRLAATGSGTTSAIRSDVIAVDNVVSVDVLENTSEVVDANGLPPHTFEVLVFDGETPLALDNEIAQAIWDTKPAGIAAVGTSSGTAVDDEGNNQTVAFTRPTIITVWMDVQVAYDGSFGAAEQLTIKNAIITEFQAFNRPGVDVIRAKGISAVIDVPNVDDVTLFEIGITDGTEVEANLAIGTKEVAAFAVARIDVSEP